MIAAEESTSASRRRPRRTVVDEIKQYILDERLAPGDPLPTEVALCEELGVSRPHLREALRTLQSLDIVTIQHGRGMRVGGLSLAPMIEALLFRARLDVSDSLRPVREVLDLRERLDRSAADELVAACGGRPQHRLREIVDQMEEAHEQGRSFAAADRAFHSELLSTLDNDLLQRITEAFWEIHSQAIPLLGIPLAEDISLTVAAHQAIVESVETGDVQAYLRAVTAHYDPLRRQLGEAD